MSEKNDSKLLVLWASGEKETAMHMVLLYANSGKRKGWWDEVTLLIWGAADLLVVEDVEIQVKLRAAREVGVRLIACKKCAEELGIAEQLKSLGVEVFYTGEFLTEWLKSGDAVLTV